LALVQDRGPVGAELDVVLPVGLEVLLPDAGPGYVVAGELAAELAADVAPNVLAVGAAGRGRAGRLVGSAPLLADLRERLPPFLLPVGTDAKQGHVVPVDGGEEDLVPPDARRRFPRPGHLELPNQVLVR